MIKRSLLVGLLFLAAAPQPELRSPVHVESLRYPALARQARIGSDVTILGDIDSDGRVSGWPILLTGHPLLAQTAIENLRTWRFQPGPKGQVKITYHFVIEGEESDYSQDVTKFDFPDSVTVSVHPPVVDIYPSPLGKSKKK